ncbi:zf-HC2 domain-containing protein [Streptomyces phaeofaciens]|uniref:Putative zinc-finger domain-containing protein n=1 Tax=Streptomyces phaeofaciens TaxID=68254 RepID=A0A918LQV2_9ACTN|nr:zf-HC2 domain-containing protein [Streptomyces phaeofaciens]GGT40677.1 hypothetical protein GCM10010226_16280 [Streptomyces phaeofaciens]
MNASSWHTDDTLAARYADGTLPDSDAWSLEKHLEQCGTCATRVSRAVARTGTATVLAEVREAVLAEARGAVPAKARGAVPAKARGAVPAKARGAVPAKARGAVPAKAAEVAGPAPLPTPVARPAVPAPRTHGARLWSSRTGGPRASAPARPLRPFRSARTGGPGGTSALARVLWAAGPAVRGAWLVAVVVVAVGAVGLAYGAGVGGVRPLLLAVAPLVPVAGVALSYGRHADPLYEIVASTPSGGLRLVLTRTAAVLGVSLPLLTLAGLLLPASGAPGAAAWLLPGLALTLASLALAGYLGPRAATAVTGGGWLVAVLVPALAGPGAAPLARLAAPGDTLVVRLTEQLSRCLDGPLAQGAWAAAAVLCAALLAVRRSAYDRLDRR